MILFFLDGSWVDDYWRIGLSQLLGLGRSRPAMAKTRFRAHTNFQASLVSNQFGCFKMRHYAPHDYQSLVAVVPQESDHGPSRGHPADRKCKLVFPSVQLCCHHFAGTVMPLSLLQVDEVFVAINSRPFVPFLLVGPGDQASSSLCRSWICCCAISQENPLVLAPYVFGLALSLSPSSQSPGQFLIGRHWRYLSDQVVRVR